MLAVGWGTLVLLHVPSHPPEGSTSSLHDILKTAEAEDAGVLKAQPCKLHNVTSASFSWPKQVTWPIRIHKRGGWILHLDRKSSSHVSRRHNSLGPKLQSLTLG